MYRQTDGFRESFYSHWAPFAPGSDVKEGKDGASTSEELELELEALDITDEPLELEGADEAENEELAKKLLDEQGKHKDGQDLS